MNSKIALLFFSRTAQKEAAVKHWLGANKQQKNKKIATQLIEQTEQFLHQLQLPVFVFNEDNQKGNTFGERFSNAYQEIFNLGYDAVISVGNDSPELTSVNWNQAINQLQQNQCVLGPSFNGGAYFVGITKTAFNKKQFEQLPWQRSELFSALFSYCEKASLTQVGLLQKLHDLNTLNDVFKLIKEGKIKKIIAFLRALILSLHSFIIVLNQAIKEIYIAQHKQLRAPPYFSFQY